MSCSDLPTWYGARYSNPNDVHLFLYTYATHRVLWVRPCVRLSVSCLFTGGHRTRVAAVTLDNMAEDAVAASVSLRQILTVSVRLCGPAFVSWLSMLWDTLTRHPELQWFGISPQFLLKVSRGDEGVGHVCFPGTRVSVGPDEGTAVCRLTESQLNT